MLLSVANTLTVRVFFSVTRDVTAATPTVREPMTLTGL